MIEKLANNDKIHRWRWKCEVGEKGQARLTLCMLDKRCCQEIHTYRYDTTIPALLPVVRRKRMRIYTMARRASWTTAKDSLLHPHKTAHALQWIYLYILSTCSLQNYARAAWNLCGAHIETHVSFIINQSFPFSNESLISELISINSNKAVVIIKVGK